MISLSLKHYGEIWEEHYLLLTSGIFLTGIFNANMILVQK